MNVPLTKDELEKNMRVRSPKRGYKCIKEKEKENEETTISVTHVYFLLFSKKYYFLK